jgi:multiple sugar transport system permease protein/raffinose/stachyose/melibiose transport system permease protein
MRKQRLSSLALNGFLLICSVVTILPFLWMLSSSFKSNIEISALSQHFLPQAGTLQNYISAIEKMNFLRYFANSLMYAALLSIITIYTSTLAGFVLCKYRFRGRDLLFGAILATMMVPGVVTIIPRYSIMQWLGWLDTYRALIVPSIFTSFGIFMMRQSCAGIPDEMLEAARIDGANEYYIFHRIVLPMLRNAISSIAIFQFLWAWEDYLWPYLMLRSEKKQLLSVALNMFSGRYSTDYAGLFAATSIAIVPVVICYLVFQRRFIEGIASSSVKG